MCAMSAIYTIIQGVLNVVMKGTCSGELYTGYRYFCDVIMSFSWLAPVIVDLVLKIICAFLTIVRFLFYNKISFSD